LQIKDHVFLVTGGGSGLGKATVELICAKGGKAVIADIDEEKGSNVANELGFPFIRTDIVKETEVNESIAVALDHFGELHGAINCAGIGLSNRVVGKKGPFPLEQFRKVIDVNLIGSFNVIRLAASAIVKSSPNEEEERGIIINTASVAAFDGQIGQAAYSASKAGIVGMTLPIARELASFGIRVLTIAPGLFDTPLLAQLPEEARTTLGRQTPFPSRLGKSHEFALLVKAMIENPMLNGETIRLDGAIRMPPR
jgi:3-hydroxyacyl-CoA dehydrogenase / 3-hydroxy-2-methylbutyryl-CoA dehydrogenase